MNIYSQYFKIPTRDLKVYSVLQEGEEESGVEWLVQFDFTSNSVDDSFEDDYKEEVVIVAPDFDTAYKYAQQYIRTKQLDEETKTEWAHAEIVSVDKR